MPNNLFLCEFHRPNIKISTFHEIIHALLHSFNSLGQKSYYFQNICLSDGVNIAIGTHRLFQSFDQVPPLPENTIILNLEPLNEFSTETSHKKYLEFLSRSTVIDYSPHNVDLLNRLGNRNIFQFKFGFFPFLNNLSVPRLDHFLFYGTISSRRKLALDSFIQRKLPLKVITNSWAFERDYEIISSKFILNISKMDNSPLEIYRLWHALCLNTPIISEKGTDLELVNLWSDYVLFIEDLEIVDFEFITKQLISPEIYFNNTLFSDSCNELLSWISSIY